MEWYRIKPIEWLLKSLTARQLTTLFLFMVIVLFFTSLYVIHLDVSKNYQTYEKVFQNSLISFLTILIFFSLLSFEMKLFLKI